MTQCNLLENTDSAHMHRENNLKKTVFFLIYDLLNTKEGFWVLFLLQLIVLTERRRIELVWIHQFHHIAQA